MVERAEARGRDDEHRRGELRGDVGERAAVVVETHGDAARAFDEHESWSSASTDAAVAAASGRMGGRPARRAAVAGASGSG